MTIIDLINDEDFGLIYMCSIRMFLQTHDWKYFKVVKHFAYSAPFPDKEIALNIRDMTDSFYLSSGWYGHLDGFKATEYDKVVEHFMRLWLVNHKNFDDVEIGKQYTHMANRVSKEKLANRTHILRDVDRKMILPLFMYAIDYSHGRMTYMPDVTAKFITRYLDLLDDDNLELYNMYNKVKKIIDKDRKSEDYDPFDHTWDYLFRDIRVNSYMRGVDFTRIDRELNYIEWVVYEVPGLVLHDQFDCEYLLEVLYKLGITDGRVFKRLFEIYNDKVDRYLKKYYNPVEGQEGYYTRKPKEEWSD